VDYDKKYFMVNVSGSLDLNKMNIHSLHGMLSVSMIIFKIGIWLDPGIVFW